MEFYELTSENLSGLGGPMGTEHTTINYVKPFVDNDKGKALDKAKAFAEKEYGKKIKWQERKEYITSGDLAWVMYTIKKVTPE